MVLGHMTIISDNSLMPHWSWLILSTTDALLSDGSRDKLLISHWTDSHLFSETHRLLPEFPEIPEFPDDDVTVTKRTTQAKIKFDFRFISKLFRSRLELNWAEICAVPVFFGVIGDSLSELWLKTSHSVSPNFRFGESVGGQFYQHRSSMLASHPAAKS